MFHATKKLVFLSLFCVTLSFAADTLYLGGGHGVPTDGITLLSDQKDQSGFLCWIKKILAIEQQSPPETSDDKKEEETKNHSEVKDASDHDNDSSKNGPIDNKLFNPLEGEETLSNTPLTNVDTNLSPFEDSIIRHLVFLGASYNKQLTFITIGLGVLIAVLFPQKTKSLIRLTGRRVKMYLAEIKKSLHLLENKIRSAII